MRVCVCVCVCVRVCVCVCVLCVCSMCVCVCSVLVCVYSKGLLTKATHPNSKAKLGQVELSEIKPCMLKLNALQYMTSLSNDDARNKHPALVLPTACSSE